MKHKYVRHSEFGFILWPMSDILIHVEVARPAVRTGVGRFISAGFADIEGGTVICYGESISMNLRSNLEDSELLAEQLGLDTTGD